MGKAQYKVSKISIRYKNRIDKEEFLSLVELETRSSDYY